MRYLGFLKSLIRPQRFNKESVTPGWLYVIFASFTLLLFNGLIGAIANIYGDFNALSTEKAQLLDSSSTIYVFLGVLVFPVLEELTYRLGLSTERKHLLISTSMILAHFITLAVLFLFNDVLGNHLLTYFIIYPVIALKASFFVRADLLHSKSFLRLLETWGQRNFKSFYFLSAILFSLAHLLFQSIYRTHSITTSVSLFLVYFGFGIIYSKMRLDKSFVFALVFHITLNAIGFARVILFPL